ncbi:MAG: AraC family transcriptional regulator [Alphaproteobacteria bacterium]|nr:MAG: AraC family transcriptional regulator [Alphaproteobacteria bacterium]
METIFHFDRLNYERCQERYRGEGRADYYDGEYTIDASKAVDVRADKKAFGPSSVIRLTSRTRLKFRRARSHIRRDNIDLSILWFVRRGSVRFISTDAQSSIAREGDVLLTRSSNPFFMECLPEADGQHDVIHVTMPTHLVRPMISDRVPSGTVLTASTGCIAIARQMVEDVFADEEGISQGSGLRLTEAVFSLVGDSIGQRAPPAARQISIAQRRIEDVMRFISVHLCDPNLNTAAVCKGCGISPRYLTSLLQMRGTSFTDLVWGQRMEKAQAWLLSSRAGEVPVSEVAHSLGFKSAAHFSRRFKRVFSYNPSDRRSG